MKRITIVSILICTALLLAGCGGDQMGANTGNANTTTTTSSTTSELPEFPWPPKASALTTIPNAYLIRGEGQGTLKSVGDRLKQAFSSAGYSQTGYYGVPGGFALVSPLEQFKNDGTPVDTEYRWTTQAALPSLFSLDYFRSLIIGKSAGHYRVIAFIVTDKLFTATGEAATVETAERLSREGGTALPPSMGNQPFGDQYTCTALIYEFEKAPGADTKAEFKASSSIMADMHLRKAKILDFLER
ncbi:MAG: hypothetical protein WCF57_02650 [Pyrinomonadaceae bacterium]